MNRRTGAWRRGRTSGRSCWWLPLAISGAVALTPVAALAEPVAGSPAAPASASAPAPAPAPAPASASADSSGVGDQVVEAVAGFSGGILLGLGGLSVIVSIPLIAASP